MVGVFRHPKSFKTAEANAKRACERLARHRSMSRKFLWRTGEVAAGNAGVLLGLLEGSCVRRSQIPPSCVPVLVPEGTVITSADCPPVIT